MKLETANLKGKCNVSKTQQGCQHDNLKSTLSLTHPPPPPPPLPGRNPGYTPEPHHLESNRGF